MAGIILLLGFSTVTCLASAQTTTANVAIPSSSLCPGANGRTIYDVNGAGYLVTCSADNDRGSYTNTQASKSYLDCMAACDADKKKPCTGFTYVGGSNGLGSGTCWLKDKMTTYPTKGSNIISAVRVSNSTNPDSSPSGSSVSSSSSSSSVKLSVPSSSHPTAAFSSTASSTAASPSSLSLGTLCPSYNFTTYADNQDNNWQILCGFDTSPSSFGVANVASFALCLEACNAKDDCVSVSYFGTACYFKRGYQDFVPFKNVNSAFIINKANYPVPSRNDRYAGRGCGSTLPPGVQVGVTSQFSINSGGLKRSFSVHVPSSYDTNKAAPLIVAFHSRSETPKNIEAYSRFSDETWNPYGIVVYPLGVAANGSNYPQWQGDPDAVTRTPYVDDQTFVQDILVHMTSDYCIDTSRILATGFSNGAGLANILACNSSLSLQFSAFALSSGEFYTNNSKTASCPQSGNVPSTILTNTLVQNVCSPGRRVPMLEFHGDGDGTISYTGGPRRGYCLPTIPHWVSDWSIRNGYSLDAVTTPMLDGQVTRYEYGSGNNQGIVTHYKVSGSGHAWFRQLNGSPVDATPIILDFLYRFINPDAQRYIPTPQSTSAVSSVATSSTVTPISSFNTTSASAAIPSASLNSTSLFSPAITPLPVNTSLSLNSSSIPAAITFYSNSSFTLPGTAVSSSMSSEITTQAPFANVTTTANSTLPTPAATGVSCPASNNTIYTDAATGAMFEVQCNDDNSASVEFVNSANIITVEGATLQDCIGFCAMMIPTCQGVSKVGSTCYLERSGTRRVVGPMGARLVKTAVL